MNTRFGLGRGLEALIPPAPSSAAIQMIDVEQIVPNPRQPRQQMSPEALAELAGSIRAHGVIQPLIVTAAEVPGADGAAQYQIVAGERRWLAAKQAGLAAVPAVVRETTTQQALELALVENIQRADLNPLEEAAAYRTLMEVFGLTQQDVALKVGRSRVAVANSVRLLKLPEEAQRALSDGRISEGHARAILRLESEAEQRRLLQQILDRGLSVRQAEDLAQGTQPQASRRRGQSGPRDPQGRHLEEQFRRALGTKVNLIRHRSGGGRLIIHFYSDEELHALHEHIVGRRR